MAHIVVSVKQFLLDLISVLAFGFHACQPRSPVNAFLTPSVIEYNQISKVSHAILHTPDLWYIIMKVKQQGNSSTSYKRAWPHPLSHLPLVTLASGARLRTDCSAVNHQAWMHGFCSYNHTQPYIHSLRCGKQTHRHIQSKSISHQSCMDIVNFITSAYKFEHFTGGKDDNCIWN